MHTPPKSDADDASTVAGSGPENGEAKKTPRRRTRYYSKGKSGAPDAAPVAGDGPKAEIFVPEPVKAEPAPASREESSPPASEPAPSPAPAEPASPQPPAERSSGAEAGHGGEFQGRGFWKNNNRKRGK